jgi:hypothetical protein
MAEGELRAQIGDTHRLLNGARAADKLAKYGAHRFCAQRARIGVDSPPHDVRFALWIEYVAADLLLPLPDLLGYRGATVDGVDDLAIDAIQLVAQAVKPCA